MLPRIDDYLLVLVGTTYINYVVDTIDDAMNFTPT
jgi:hypothetical protein